MSWSLCRMTRVFLSMLAIAAFLMFSSQARLAISDESAENKPEEPKVLEQQIRTFKVSVDGTERGTMTMSLHRHSDGTEVMRGQAELTFNYIVYKYRYKSSGTETWKDGRLIRLANEADYNGDKYVVQASAEKQELTFEVNGEGQRAAADVWVTSYWREPESNKIGQKLSLLDPDKGRRLAGTLERVGPETLTIAKKKMDVKHYQIRGEVEVDLWYDDEGRLVRQHSLESGHRALLEMTRIQR